jgi:hypothetical protein
MSLIRFGALEEVAGLIPVSVMHARILVLCHRGLLGIRGGMPPDGRLYFSLYELLGVMRKVRKGGNYKDLKASLLRLSATHFQADNAFYLKDKNKLATRTFTLWDVSLDTEVDNETGETTERHFLEFHNIVRQSFQAEYLKTLDSEFYFSLRSPLAKRLYRLIDRNRQGKSRRGTSLDKLKDMVPLAPSYKTPSKIRDVLETAHAELQRRGFLAGVSYETLDPPLLRRTSQDSDLARFADKGKEEQLSWMSTRKIVRIPPGSPVFEDGVEDREQLAHAGHQSHLLRFAGRQETLVEFPYDRVAARGDQGAHVQRRSDLGPPSPHATMATQSARVAV